MRVVAPLTYEKFTLLPRLTLRHYENKQTGETGIGNTELFGLIIPKKLDWGYGLAGAAVNSSGKWFYGLLLTQSWQSVDPNNLPAGTPVMAT